MSIKWRGAWVIEFDGYEGRRVLPLSVAPRSWAGWETAVEASKAFAAEVGARRCTPRTPPIPLPGKRPEPPKPKAKRRPKPKPRPPAPRREPAPPRVTGYAVRYPLADVEALLGWPPKALLAKQLGVEPSKVETWRRRGLTHDDADQVACTIDMHPVNVWPAWLDNARIPYLSGPTVLPTTRQRPEVSVWDRFDRRQTVDAGLG